MAGRRGTQGGYEVGIGRSSPDFATLLRQLRTSAGLTQEELAESAALSPRTISDLERRVSLTARAPTARFLATALNLTGSARTEFLAAAHGPRVPAAASTDPSAPRPESDAGLNRTLPRDISAFTGRAEELQQTVRAVTTASGGGVIGICAIGGMAGIGKTTLAVHAAHALAPQFPDGQIFVALHGHTPGQRPADPADVLAGLLLAAGIDARRIPADRDGRERCWRDYLADKKLLLVLDDAIGHDQVGPLLPGSGGSTALVTSRQRLTALEDASIIDLDTLPKLDAGRLLIRLSGRIELQAHDPVVAEITNLCGYLPLAIGMLARQLHHHPVWSPAGLAADLAAATDRLGMMRNENISVAAAFDLSYRDLTGAQRRLFRLLGLHPGPDIDRYAAAALANVSLTTARRQLEALYDQHLITQPATGRYRLHDLLREHAGILATSDDPADNEAATGRILGYYLHTALGAAEHIPLWPFSAAPQAPVHPPAHQPPIASVGQAISWMESERMNLYAVASYAAETGRRAYTIALSAAMAGFLEARGPWDRAIAMQRDAIAAARETDDKAGQARNLILLASLQVITGNRQIGATTCAKALKIYHDLGDLGGQADTFAGLTDLHTGTGEYQLAAEYARQALALFTELGLHRGRAEVLALLSALHQALGDFETAFAVGQEALQLATAHSDGWGQMNAVGTLGILERLTGNYATAELYQRKALELAGNYQDLYRLGLVINELGVLQRLTGDYQAAAASLGNALDEFRAHSHLAGIAMVSNDLGLLQQLTGDYQAAAASHREALTIYTDLGLRPSEAQVLNSLGELSARTENPVQARDYHTRARSIARDLPAPLEEARALEGIGRSKLGENMREAEIDLRAALDIYRRLGTPDAARVQQIIEDLVC